ncbi:Chaperone surA [Gossypium australe]|uniref:Chaperone surA n=1 Tax=Gossypium australe TaxID=47621 RepID=A0A5B6X4F4_9ROSI|nr:Chaperone surA [Gossypium australe]
MDSNLDQTAVDNAASNASAPAQGTAPASSRPEILGQGEKAREAFLHMMSNWYTEYTRVNPNAQPPPPSPIPQPVPVAAQVVEVVRRQRPPIDKIQKQRAIEFQENKDDDLERAEFWLENTIRLSCRPEECLKCTVSLLRHSAYRWWNTLVSVVPRERRFIDHKKKEFLELKEGRMSVTDYEREFVRLSKYA